MSALELSEQTTLPADRYVGALAARVWRPDVKRTLDRGGQGRRRLRRQRWRLPTMRDLCEAPSPAEALRAAEGPRIGALEDILARTPRDRRDPRQPAPARANRLAGDQGGRRHLRPIAPRARDRGACPRKPRRRGQSARGDRARAGRRPHELAGRVRPQRCG